MENINFNNVKSVEFVIVYPNETGNPYIEWLRLRHNLQSIGNPETLMGYRSLDGRPESFASSKNGTVFF